MTIRTASGTIFEIGPATTDATNTEGEYAALTPYKEVGEVESLGEFGDESPSVDFAAIGDARVRKQKGARDAGTMELVVGEDPDDAGQLALIAAEATSFEYAFRVTANDARTVDWSNSIFYFRGLVMSKRRNTGENDNIVRRTFMIGINSEILEIPSEET